MGKKVSKENMSLTWIGTDRSRVSFTWTDPYNKSIMSDVAAYDAITGYRIRFLYKKDLDQTGFLVSDDINVSKKDLGWQPARYEIEWDTPEHTLLLKAQVRIDIDTSKYGDWEILMAEWLYGDFISQWDIGGDDSAWWAESDVIWGGYIQNTPQPPTVEIVDDKHYELLMISEYIPSLEDMDAKYMQYSIHEDKYDPFFANIPYKIVRSQINYYGTRAIASARVNLIPGKKYYVKCRWIADLGVQESIEMGLVSYWSEWSEEIITRPAFNSNDIKMELYSDTPTSAVLVSPTAETATSYTIEWAKDRSYFDTGSSQVGSNTSPTNTIRAEGLETGNKYYFRVKATNDAGDSEWRYVPQFIIIGKRPSPPTTWTYNTSIDVGDDIIFFWTHNSEDGSVQKAAQLYLNINGITQTINVPVDTSLKEDKEYSYIFKTTSYTIGAVIKWKMRTKGILNTGENEGWSDWSVERQVRINAKPIVNLSYISEFAGIIDKYPIKLRCQCGPNSLVPISYNLIVQANQNYVGTSNTGEKVTITKGSEIYNSFISMYDFSDNPYDFYINLYPKNLSLSNDIDYKFIIQMAMDTGSSAMDTLELHTSFEEDGKLLLSLDCAVSPNTYSVLLKPVVYDISDLPEEDPGDDYKPPLSSNKIIDIYRKDAISNDYILISGNIQNIGSTTVIDPHPSLKSTTYRLVSTDTETGEIKWNDIDLTYSNILFPSIIIQWDENTNVILDKEYSEDGLYDAPVSGNMLLLPYNIKTSESNSKDMSHVEYIGRKHPVSYFGTQLGETASWSCEFDKTDEITIQMLRKLALWTDDVYVREPSGTGYWATVNISFNNDYDSLVIPVTIEVTRVEGDRP